MTLGDMARRGEPPTGTQPPTPVPSAPAPAGSPTLPARRELFSALARPVQEAISRPAPAAPAASLPERIVSGGPVTRREFNKTMAAAGIAAATPVIPIPAAAAPAALPAAGAVGLPAWSLAQELALTQKHLGRVLSEAGRMQQAMGGAEKFFASPSGKAVEQTLATLSNRVKLLEATAGHTVKQGYDLLPRDVFIGEGGKPYRLVEKSPARYAEGKYTPAVTERVWLDPASIRKTSNPREIPWGRTDSKRTREALHRATMRRLQAEGHDVHLGDTWHGSTSRFIIQKSDGSFVKGRGAGATLDAADARIYRLDGVLRAQKRFPGSKIISRDVKWAEPRAGKTYVEAVYGNDTRVRGMNLDIPSDIGAESPNTIANAIAKSTGMDRKKVQFAVLKPKTVTIEDEYRGGKYESEVGANSVLVRGTVNGRSMTVEFNPESRSGSWMDSMYRRRIQPDIQWQDARPSAATIRSGRDVVYYRGDSLDPTQPSAPTWNTRPGMISGYASPQGTAFGPNGKYLHKARINAEPSEVLTLRYNRQGDLRWNTATLRRIIKTNTGFDVGKGPIGRRLADLVRDMQQPSRQQTGRGARGIMNLLGLEVKGGWASTMDILTKDVLQKAGYKVVRLHDAPKRHYARGSDVYIVDDSVLEPISARNIRDLSEPIVVNRPHPAGPVREGMPEIGTYDEVNLERIVRERLKRIRKAVRKSRSRGTGG